MYCINVEDIEPMGLSQLVHLLESSDLENVACAMLVASVIEGEAGKIAQIAVSNALSMRGDAAFEQLMDLVPIDIRDAFTGENFGERFDFITDGLGNFAMIIARVQACFGTGAEIAHRLFIGAMRACRKVTADPNASADARYRATMMARRNIRLIS